MVFIVWDGSDIFGDMDNSPCEEDTFAEANDALIEAQEAQAENTMQGRSTRKAVEKKLLTGVSAHAYKGEYDDALIKKLYEQGLSLRNIAERLSVSLPNGEKRSPSPNTIRNRLRKMGYTLDKKS